MNGKTMSNNKQSMKLYTEEEIKRGLDNPVSFDMTTDEFISSLSPIELPSDEEVWDKAKYEHEMCVFADEYASYVLEQSKSGIKGAMVSMCAWTFFKNRRNEQQ